MSTDRKLMRSYLLGTASEQERGILEDSYLSDANALEELKATENDLIDSYARGHLSGIEKQQFERIYMSVPKLTDRVEFSRALRQVAPEFQQASIQEKQRPWQLIRDLFSLHTLASRWGLAAACAIVLVVAVSITNSKRIGPQTAQLHRPRATAPPSINAAPLPPAPNVSPQTESARNEAHPLGDFPIRLDETTVSRSLGADESKTFVVPSHTSTIVLSLILEDDQSSTYIVVVETPEGKEIRRFSGLMSRMVAGKNIVAIRIPASLVPSGSYIVELKGETGSATEEESLASYGLSVQYKRD